MIKAINKYTKNKQRKLYTINSLQDLNDFDFVKEIPKNSLGVEITCKYNNMAKTLEIDYILESHTDNFSLGESNE